MKRLFKWLARVVGLALALMLAFSLWPYFRSAVTSLIGKMDYSQAAQTLTHEMREVGKLTAVEYKDTGVMDAKTDALLLGTIQKVTVPYQYEISLGIDLSLVQIESVQDGLNVYLPDVELISDKLTVTGDAQIEDFWHLMTENRYQAMLDSQALSLREGYINNKDTMDRAYDSAQKALEKFFSGWIKDSGIRYSFRRLSEERPAQPSAIE